MPEFTAKDVKALRDSTGAGMMDAKRALEANDGDMEAAAFNAPQGLAADMQAIYVADTGNHAIRRIDGESGDYSQSGVGSPLERRNSGLNSLL